jgi:hypothetical protein
VQSYNTDLSQTYAITATREAEQQMPPRPLWVS